MLKFAILCSISIIIILSSTNLTDLLESDTNGDLQSHMFLAATHDYDVSPDGIVTIDGRRYEIWPEVRMVA